jgi:hypothetical protein
MEISFRRKLSSELGAVPHHSNGKTVVISSRCGEGWPPGSFVEDKQIAYA